MKKMKLAISIALAFLLTSCGGNSGTDASSSIADIGGSDTSSHIHSYIEEVTSPTCTEGGYTTYTCACGESYKDDYVDALGHDLVHHEGVEATCLEGGYADYDTCSRCDYSTYEEIAAAGHSFGEYVVEISPNCTQDGIKVRTCTECGFREEEVVEALGHDLTHHEGKEATCLEGGYAAYDTCSRCDYSTYEAMAARSHHYVDRVCTICGDSKEVSWNVELTLSYSKTYYTVTGRGTATESDLVLPSVLNGLPVLLISNNAFYNDTTITSVDISSSTTTIGDYAFYGCTNLASVTFGDSVTNIGGRAFGKTGLTEVVLPASLTTLPSFHPFSECPSLTSLSIEDGGATYYSENNCIISRADGTLALALGTSVIPRSVTAIGDYAYSFMTGLISIAIPDWITRIGSYAFDNCTALTSVIIPNSVTSFGGGVFAYCTSLTSIEIPGSLASIGANSFSNCTSLTDVVISDGVECIETGVFNSCTSLTNLSIGSGLTTIQDNAFQNCTSLTSIVFPASLTSLASRAFSGCTSLANLSIEEGGATFYSENNCLIAQADNTLVLGLSGSIPDSVTAIGAYAFSTRSSLTSVEIPDTVTTIKANAFSGCSSLESIYFGAGVTTIEDRAFASCPLLDNISISADNPTFYVESNCLINREESLLVIGNNSGIIPSSVLGIASYAYYGRTGLSSIEIPTALTHIYTYAFYGCKSLTSITVPGSVAYIGAYAFSGCSSLTSATFEKTAGWKAKGSSRSYSLILADASSAATYLKSTYAAYEWSR